MQLFRVVGLSADAATLTVVLGTVLTHRRSALSITDNHFCGVRRFAKMQMHVIRMYVHVSEGLFRAVNDSSRY